MNLSDILDRIKSEARNMFDKIIDSAAYGQIKDKYDSLSPAAQKLVLAGTSILIVLIFLSFPWSYFSESRDNIQAFEDRRQLLRDMLKVYRETSDAPQIPAPPPPETIGMQVEERLGRMGLVKMQRGPIDVLTEKSDLVSQGLNQGIVRVTLNSLNLNQLVAIGYELQSIHPAVKLKDMSLEANQKDPRYFDVVYKLMVLAIKATASEPEPDEKPGKKKPKKTDEDNN